MRRFVPYRHRFQISICFVVFSLFIRMAVIAQVNAVWPNLPSINNGTPLFSNTTQSSSARSSALSYPVYDCFTYTFKLTIGNAGSDILINDLTAVNSGKTFLVGQSSTNGNVDAVIQQLDETGQLAWTKTLGVSGRMESIKSIRKNTNGNLLIIGNTMLPDSSDKKIFMGEVDLDGNIRWLRSLSGVTGYKSVGIVSSVYGIGFVAADDSTIVFGKLDIAGSLAWLNRMRPMDKGKALGIVAGNYPGWAIGYTGTDSSRLAGMVIQVNEKGIISWIDKLGGASSDADFILHDIAVGDLRPKLSGIYSEHKGPYQLCKSTLNGSGTQQTLQTFSVPGLAIDQTATSIIGGNAQVIAFYPKAGSTDLYTFRSLDGATPDTTVAWRWLFSNTSGGRLTAVRPIFDGGFMFSMDKTNVLPYTKADLIKIDSTGWLKGCEGTDFKLSTVINYVYPVSSYVRNATSVTASLVNENWPLTGTSIASDFTCRQLACPVRPIEDSCVATYLRRYRSTGFQDLGISLLVNDNFESIVAGSVTTGLEETATGGGTFSKFDARGKLMERKTFNLGTSGAITQLLQLSDGNFAGAGNSVFKDTSYFTISKFSPSMNLLWNRSFPVYPYYNNDYGLLEGSDGSIFNFYEEGSVFSQKISLVKLDKNGKLLWKKNYTPAKEITMGYGSMCQDQDYLYFAVYNYNNYGSAMVMKINKNTGDILWSNSYKVPNSIQSNTISNLSFLGDNLVMHGLVDLGISSHTTILVVNKSGAVVTSRTIQNQNSGLGLEMVVTKNNNLVFSGLNYDRAQNLRFDLFLRFDSDLKLSYARRSMNDTYLIARSLKEAKDNSIYSTGYFVVPYIYFNDMFLRKSTFDGLTGQCASDTIPLTYGEDKFDVLNNPLTVTNSTVALESLPYTETAYSLQENLLLCSGPATCSNAKVSGKSSVCDTAVYTFKAIKNSGCTQPVVFLYDTSVVRKISVTDSTLEVRFIKPGQALIKAGLFNGCRWIYDSINVSVANSVISKPDLGEDKILCNGNPVVLHAGSGFNSYLWQDGSTDSIYTVSTPGIYYVQVQSACNILLADTIEVKTPAQVSINIGPDRVKCNNDTLQLQAPSGFISYSWLPNYQVTAAATQTAIVNPQVDTSYYLKAEISSGCFVYDTIKIGVHHSPVINLGRDTSFCEGDSIILNTGPGFQSYKWSNAVTTQQVVLKTVDSYSVIATTPEGCMSYDTLKVIDLYRNPVVSLGNDSTVCIGNTRILQAGNGYKNYLWNDGSTTPSLTVNSTGTYSVSVTDQNGCRAASKLSITKQLPSPSGFLPVDTTICSNATLFLKPLQSYNQYVWNTGSSNSAITVSQNGIYWLEVKDNNSCKGRDSITVSIKNDCLIGFYAPNAFTPDNNGKNDLFKPVLFGNIVTYQFSIFSRWGERVFYSTTPGKGWNGKINGKDCNPGIFVWTCQYKVEGGTSKSEKGTVILVR